MTDTWTSAAASRRALVEMLGWLEAEHGLSRVQAIALMSVAVELRISQVVDLPNPLVSAALPLDVFAETPSRAPAATSAPAPRAAPALATTTSPIAASSRAPSTSPSTTKPASAAIAGSRLISTPNTPAGSRRSASNSSEYGIAEERIATPRPIAEHRGVEQLARRRRPRRTGSTSAQATTIASARPAPPGIACPMRAPTRMYAAQNAPASSASATPVPSKPPPGSASSRMPAAASTTQSRSSARREPNTATPSGPTNSNVTATPSGMRSSDA